MGPTPPASWSLGSVKASPRGNAQTSGCHLGPGAHPPLLCTQRKTQEPRGQHALRLPSTLATGSKGHPARSRVAQQDWLGGPGPGGSELPRGPRPTTPQPLRPPDEMPGDPRQRLWVGTAPAAATHCHCLEHWPPGGWEPEYPRSRTLWRRQRRGLLNTSPTQLTESAPGARVHTTQGGHSQPEGFLRLLEGLTGPNTGLGWPGGCLSLTWADAPAPPCPSEGHSLARRTTVTPAEPRLTNPHRSMGGISWLLRPAEAT